MKSFLLFLESESSGGEDNLIKFIKTGYDEDYGLPTVGACWRDDLYSGGSWEDPDFDNREELFDIYIESDHGPLNGADCWSSVDSCREDWAEAKNKEEKKTAKMCAREWLDQWEIPGVDIERFMEDEDYYYEIQSKYIKNSRAYFEKEVYPLEEVWNYLVITFIPGKITPSSHLDYVDTYSTRGDLLKAISGISSKVFICLAYKKGDPNFYFLRENNSFEKSPYTKAQSPEQIRDLVIKNNLNLAVEFISTFPEEKQREILPLLPEYLLDKFVLADPMGIDLLDGSPELKKEVLQRTGVKDLSQISRSVRRGFI